MEMLFILQVTFSHPLVLLRQELIVRTIRENLKYHNIFPTST